jgi:secreted trypsin-like serine protease
MKFTLIASILIFLAVSSTSQEEISQLIVNGENARVEDHPYMVNVASTGLSYCGGAILTARSVVTVRIIQF